MTVSEFARSYFALGSKITKLLVRRNNNGICQNLYSGDIHSEIYMRPEVKTAVVRKWLIPKGESAIVVIVE